LIGNSRRCWTNSPPGDRYQREVEAIGETTPAHRRWPGVPEPHEWLLIGLAVALLIYMSLKKRPDLSSFDPKI
jgi:hypothetical protein